MKSILFNHFNFIGSISEIPMLGIALLVLFVFALLVGKSRMVAFNLAFYPAILIYLYFPLQVMEKISFFGADDRGIFLNSGLIFFFFFLLAFIVIYAITGKTLAYSGRKKILNLGALAVATLALTLVVICQIVPLPNKENLIPFANKIFQAKAYFVWILTSALLITVLFGRK